jgi:hypothetical protein
MNPPSPKLIDRKQICDALGISIFTLLRHEVEWGVDKCKSAVKKKPVLYFPERLNKALKKANVISSNLFI